MMNLKFMYMSFIIKNYFYTGGLSTLTNTISSHNKRKGTFWYCTYQKISLPRGALQLPKLATPFKNLDPPLIRYISDEGDTLQAPVNAPEQSQSTGLLIIGSAAALYEVSLNCLVT